VPCFRRSEIVAISRGSREKTFPKTPQNAPFLGQNRPFWAFFDPQKGPFWAFFGRFSLFSGKSPNPAIPMKKFQIFASKLVEI